MLVQGETLMSKVGNTLRYYDKIIREAIKCLLNADSFEFQISVDYSLKTEVKL